MPALNLLNLASLPEEALVAATILQQLGGRRFVLFTGARDFRHAAERLSFSIDPTEKAISRVSVTLEADDTYTVRGFAGDAADPLAEETSVYAEDLADRFTEMTGLYTHF